MADERQLPELIDILRWPFSASPLKEMQAQVFLREAHTLLNDYDLVTSYGGKNVLVALLKKVPHQLHQMMNDGLQLEAGKPARKDFKLWGSALRSCAKTIDSMSRYFRPTAGRPPAAGAGRTTNVRQLRANNRGGRQGRRAGWQGDERKGANENHRRVLRSRRNRTTPPAELLG